MDKTQKHWNARFEEHKSLSEKTIETKQNLDNITNSLKVVEQHNETLRGDVALNRRTTYATEEAVIAIEVLKRKQDIIIDECQERIKIISDKVDMAKAQFEGLFNLILKEFTNDIHTNRHIYKIDKKNNSIGILNQDFKNWLIY